MYRYRRHLAFDNPRSSRPILLPTTSHVRVDTMIDHLEAGGYTAAEFFRILREVRKRSR
jgi:hypothetical protein